MPHPPAGLAASDWRALVLVLVAILFWACSILPEDLTGLAFFAAAMILAVAPAEAVFSGFAATAVWLVFGGLVIGAAAAKTGLDRAVAAPFRPRYRQSYARCVALTLLLATALAFLVPATMTRVLLLVPIVSALAQDLGYPKGSSGHAGLAVAAIFGSHFPAMVILPATVPTVALVGAADAFLNLPVTYGAFLWTHGPVLGLGKALLLFFVILQLFPADAPSPAVAAAETGGIDPARRRLAWLLAAALVLWTTDALHGIAAAWVALA
ncbi:MAG: SLC13 family permease, partial [Pseudomonadota bacterium]